MGKIPLSKLGHVEGMVEVCAETVSKSGRPKTGLVIALIVLLLSLLGIAGFPAYQNYQLKEGAAGIRTRLIPTATPVAMKPITDWKTYTSDVNKFQIKYPPDWEIIDPARIEEPNKILLILKSPIVIDSPTEPLVYGVTLYNYGPAEGKTAKQLVDEEVNDLRTHARGLSEFQLEARETITVGGETAEWAVGFLSRSGSVEVVFVHNDSRYKFLFSPYELDIPEWQSEKYEVIFREILSIFKFVE